MKTNKIIGRKGEDFAVACLEKNQFHIVARNWRHGHCELDIIAIKNDVVHFVEVKTLRSLRFGFPECKMTRKKFHHMSRAAEEYLRKQNILQRIQFDVFSVHIQKKKIEFLFIPDVYF